MSRYEERIMSKIKTGLTANAARNTRSSDSIQVKLIELEKDLKAEKT